MKLVRVKTCARLHLGFYNFYDETSMIAYGGIGVGIDKPCIDVIIRYSGGKGYRIVNHTSIPLNDIIRKIDDVLEPSILDGLKIDIINAIPRHVGLGSTTQSSLAIAYGIVKIKRLEYSIDELALRLGRGYVSGIGISVFKYGGLIIDRGRYIVNGVLPKPHSVKDLPRPIFRFKLPKNWYFIILIPEGTHDYRESEENDIFKKPVKVSENLQRELYRILLMEFIPSIIDGNVRMFGKALTRIQYITGKIFSKYQYGIFCCKEAEELASILLNNDVEGIGQSSWGPTIYGVSGDYLRAKKLLSNVLREAKRKRINVIKGFIARPRNKGVTIKTM